MSEHYSEPDIENSDPLYVIDDEDDNLYSISDGSDFRGQGYTKPQEEGLRQNKNEYDESDSDSNIEDQNRVGECKGRKPVNILGLLLKIMTTPVEGWKELKRRRLNADKVASGCFYPLIGIASASEFAPKLWGSTIEVSSILTSALITFMSLFFGYFSILLLGGRLLPKKVRELMAKDLGKEFVMMNMSTLALFYTIYNLLPMIDPILVFLPIWTIYLVYKGVKILRVPQESENNTQLLLSILIVGTPVAWNWLCMWFLK